MKHHGRIRDYLEHIADAIERATRYAKNAGTLEALERDEQAQDAIVRTISVIGEAAGLADSFVKRWKTPIDFHTWVRRIGTPPERVAALQSVFSPLPREAVEYFKISDEFSFAFETA